MDLPSAQRSLHTAAAAPRIGLSMCPKIPLDKNCFTCPVDQDKASEPSDTGLELYSSRLHGLVCFSCFLWGLFKLQEVCALLYCAPSSPCQLKCLQDWSQARPARIISSRSNRGFALILIFIWRCIPNEKKKRISYISILTTPPGNFMEAYRKTIHFILFFFSLKNEKLSFYVLICSACLKVHVYVWVQLLPFSQKTCFSFPVTQY